MDIRLANEFEDLFIQLFYSTEVWGYFGIAIVIAFFFVVSYKVKYSFSVFVPILVIMSLDYLGKMTATGYYAWHFLILIVSSFFLGIMGFQQFSKKD